MQIAIYNVWKHIQAQIQLRRAKIHLLNCTKYVFQYLQILKQKTSLLFWFHPPCNPKNTRPNGKNERKRLLSPWYRNPPILTPFIPTPAPAKHRPSGWARWVDGSHTRVRRGGRAIHTQQSVARTWSTLTRRSEGEHLPPPAPNYTVPPLSPPQQVRLPSLTWLPGMIYRALVLTFKSRWEVDKIRTV